MVKLVPWCRGATRIASGVVWRLAWGLCLALALAPGLAVAQRNLAVAATPAQPVGEPRVALVIGNADYPAAPLANPVNDARAVAERLAALGFRVNRLEDASQEQMYDAIRVFGDTLRAGGVGLFYYAGHALQVRGRNLLLPVRARIEREDEILYRTVDVGQVLDKMDSARNRVNIVILDACRSNPFGREFRSVAPGLAVMDAPHNTLIAYATAPGAVASDGSGRHGLYTQHLLQALARPGLGLEEVFKQVRTGVRQDSAGRQVPWENTSLEVAFFFDPLPTPTPPAPAAAPVPAAPPAPAPAPAPAPGRPDALTVELAFWDSVKASTDPEDFRAYLQRYPDGQFAVLARNRLRALDRPAAAPPVPAPTAPTAPTAATAATPATAATSATAATAPTVVSSTPAAAITAPPAPVPPTVVSPTAVSPTIPPPPHAANGLQRLPGRALADGAGDTRVLAVARTGMQAVSGAADGSLRLWDLAAGRLLRRFGGPGGALTALAFSADGQHLLTGSADRRLRWWSVASGAALLALAGHAGAVTAVAVAPTGRHAVSAADDGELLLWALPGGELLQRVRASERPLTALALSPDGRWVLTGDAGGGVQAWDVGGLKPLRRFGPLPAAVVALGFAGDGRRVVAVAASGAVRLWAMPGGEALVAADAALVPPVRAAVAPDGAGLLAAGADGRVQWWPLAAAPLQPRGELGWGTGAVPADAPSPGVPAGTDQAAGLVLTLGAALPGGGVPGLVAGRGAAIWWWRLPP